MKYSNFDKIVSVKIGAYKLLLIDFLAKNEELASVISKTYYDSNVGIVEWIENIEADSFFEFNNKWRSSMKPRLSFKPNVYTDLEMAYINKLIGSNPKNYFNEEFSSLESLKAKGHFPYYIYDEKILKELDFDFFQLIPEHNAIGEDAIERKISERVSIKFVSALDKLEYQSIRTYQLPELYVVIKGNEEWICEEAGVTGLLFLEDKCFTIFVRNRIDPLLNASGNVISFVNKTDEPMTVSNSLTNRYYVTNSEGAKVNYNLYISLTLSLSALFFDIFEKWLVNEVVDQLEICSEL